MCGGCARVGAPPGGPKDVTPPRVVEYKPPNQSVFFHAPVIEIKFNEFIQLDQIRKKLIVSPPLPEKPEVRIKGKGIVIRLNNSLRDSTTYTLNFGDAIKDYTEGNVLENFTYVFSTGSYIDSLQVHGRVLEAFDLTPPEEATVMLYNNLSDSAPFTEKPLYVCKTNPYGAFLLKNLKADTFRLYALVDANINYMYDPGSDEVAFLDTVLYVFPGTGYDPFPDSLVTDSLYTAPGHSFTLRLFAEDMEEQYLKSYDRTLPEFIILIFNRPAPGAVISLADTVVADWYLPEHSVTGDTLGLWITDTALAHLQRLTLVASYETVDSSGAAITASDTISLRIKTPKGRKKQEEKKALLEVVSSLSRNRQELNRDLTLLTSRPLAGYDTSRFRFTRLQDTLELRQPFTFAHDTFFLRRYHLSCPWEEGSQYRLQLLPGAFTDIYGATNDTTQFSFRTATLEDYGTLILNLTLPSRQTVIQLWDNNEKKLIRQYIVSNDTTLRFSYLSPGKYIVKAWQDDNGNGKWDPGNLTEKRQPEPVSYFDKVLEIKANWDMEETWNIRFDFRMNPFQQNSRKR